MVFSIMDGGVKSSLSMFADDTAIVAHGVNLNDVITQITDDIGKLSKWFGYNKLTVNLDKTKCMYFGKSEHYEDESMQLNVNGVQMELVKSFSYLGIIIDNKLQFNDHIKRCKLFRHNIRFICYQGLDTINKITALVVFKSMILR